MDASNPGIRGIIIGQNTFVENIINQLDDKDNYEIYSNGIIDSLEKH